MKLFIRSAAAYALLCFFILLAISLSFHESDRHLTLLSTPADVIKTFGVYDPASFMSGALDIAKNGWLSPQNHWLGNLWPPGFMLLEAGIIKILGAQAPIVLVLQLLSCALLACTMTLQRQVLLKAASLRLASIIPLLILVFTTPRLFLIEDYGVVLGETLSISFFMSAIFVLILFANDARAWPSVLSGVLFAASAYFRSQYEIIVLAMTGVGILILSFKVYRRYRYRSPLDPTFKTIAICLLTAHIVMMPWRIYHYNDMRSPSWVFTSQLIAINSLTPVDTLEAAGGLFVINGGGYLACHYESEYCGKKDPKLFYEAFFRHAPQWIWEKIRLLPEFWFRSTPIPSVKGPTPPFTLEGKISNTIFLGAFLGVCVLLVKRRRCPAGTITGWVWLSVLGSYAAILVLAHIEYRYLYFPKILSFVLFCTLLVRFRHGLPGAIRNI